MPVTAPNAVTAYGLLIQPSGMFRLLDWTETSTPCRALRCDTARPVDVTTQVLMWVDEDAGGIGHRANRAAYSLTCLYVPGALHYWGDVVFTGSTTASGDLLGLTTDQASALVETYLDHVATGLIPRQFGR